MLIFAAVSVLTFAAAGYLSLKETKESVDEFFDTYQMALARNLSSVDWQHMNSAIKKQTDKNLKHIRNADDDDDAIGFAVFNLEGQRVFDDNEKGLDFSYNGNVGAFQTEIIDDEPWRVVRIKSADGRFIIAVGQELDYRDDIAWDMTEEFMLPWMWGLGLLLLIMLVAVSYEFKPLKNLIGNIKNRSPEDLSAIPTDKLPSEIVPLVNSLNGLLAKIEKMLSRERRFVADAAHELRTPLTALQVQLEVLEMSDDDVKARKKAADNLSQGLKRAAHLVEQLLALSRLDVSLAAGQTDKEPIDWKHLAQEVCNEYQATAAEKKTEFERLYKEYADSPKTERNRNIAEAMAEYFEDDRAAQDFVRDNTEHKKRNEIVRRTRLARKIHLQEWNWFCTFTYDDGKHTVIRPLAYVREYETEKFAKLRGYPLAPKGLCGAGENLKRQEIKELMKSWDREFPGRVYNLFMSLQRVSPSHLMDKSLYDFHNFVSLVPREEEAEEPQE